MRITDDKLHGRVVLTADGLALGEVSKLFLKGGAFAIDAIEVKLRREMAERLGLKAGAFKTATFEVPANLVQSVGDAVLLSAPFSDLLLLNREIPHETREQIREDRESFTDTRRDSSRQPLRDRSPART
jgi:sporulation protein YlmC with PRC-barrel domain